MKAFAILICIAVAGFVGYVISERNHERTQQGVAQQAPVSAQLPPQSNVGNALGMPWDYFPMMTNKRWVYNIMVASKDVRPLHHRVTIWPKPNNTAAHVETRGILLDRASADGKTQLVLRVVGPAIRQGTLSYPEGFEVVVERDDLNIYEYATKIFWAVSRSRGYSIEEVITVDPNSPGAPSSYGPWGSSDSMPGESQRFVFFGEKPGTQLSIVDRNDALLFVGPETLQGQPALHFRRTIKKNERSRDVSHLDSPFTEDMWFKKGTGLTKLEQRVDDKVTMTWILDEHQFF